MALRRTRLVQRQLWSAWGLIELDCKCRYETRLAWHIREGCECEKHGRQAVRRYYTPEERVSLDLL